MRVSRFLAGLGLALATAAAAAIGGGSALAEEPLKVGFVYVSPVGDAGWTYQHDLGRKELEAALGDKVKISFVESVPEGADAERVIREYAAIHVGTHKGGGCTRIGDDNLIMNNVHIAHDC